MVATIDDYAAVRELVADLVAAGVDATVKPDVRETVEAVAYLIKSGAEEVTQTALRERLTSTSRPSRAASPTGSATAT